MRKICFYGNNQLNCISSWLVRKIFFWSEFPYILEKSRRGKKTNSKAIAKRFALQANADIIFHNTSWDLLVLFQGFYFEKLSMIYTIFNHIIICIFFYSEETLTIWYHKAIKTFL